MESTSRRFVQPDVPEGVTDKIQQKRQKAKSYHDRNAKVLPDLDIGQEVRTAPIQRGKSWKWEPAYRNFLTDHTW